MPRNGCGGTAAWDGKKDAFSSGEAIPQKSQKVKNNTERNQRENKQSSKKRGGTVQGLAGLPCKTQGETKIRGLEDEC